MVFSALLHKARSALIWRNHPQRRCFLLPLGEIFDAIWCQIKINTKPNVPNLSKSSFLWSHIFFSIFWHSEALHWPRDRKGGPQHVKLLFVVLTGNAAPYGRQRIYGDILMIIYVFESNRFKASKSAKQVYKSTTSCESSCAIVFTRPQQRWLCRACRENTNADSVLRNTFKNSRSCSIWGLFLASARPLLRLTPADEFWQIWTDTKSIKEPRLRQGSSRLNFNQLSTPAFGRLPTSPHRGIARWGFSSLAWRKCPEMADASIQPKSCIVTRCLAKTTQSNAIPSHNKDLFFDRSICCSPAWPSLYSISSISSSDSSKSPVSSLRDTNFTWRSKLVYRM